MVGSIGQGLESRGAMGTSTVRGLVNKRRRPWSVFNTNHVFNKMYYHHLILLRLSFMDVGVVAGMPGLARPIGRPSRESATAGLLPDKLPG